jgi:MoaA/NifB/PqqE/SkfB family radical SAM enzyme
MTPFALKSVTLLLTRHCNYNCAFCRISKSRVERELSGAEWRLVVRRMKALGVETFVIAGGEPTLKMNALLESLREIAQPQPSKGTSILVSNGQRLWRHPELCSELLAAGLDGYSSSVDDEHLAPEGVLDVGDNGLQTLRLMRLLGCDDCTASLVLYRKNADVLPELIEELSEEGIWTVLSVVHAQADASGFEFRSWDASLLPSREQVERFTERVLKAWPRLKVHTPKAYFERLPAVYSEDGKYKWHCTRPGRLEVDADGCLKPCTDLRTDLSVLTATDGELYSAWQSAASKCPGCYYACTAGAEMPE